MVESGKLLPVTIILFYLHMETQLMALALVSIFTWIFFFYKLYTKIKLMLPTATKNLSSDVIAIL